MYQVWGKSATASPLKAEQTLRCTDSLVSPVHRFRPNRSTQQMRPSDWKHFLPSIKNGMPRVLTPVDGIQWQVRHSSKSGQGATNLTAHRLLYLSDVALFGRMDSPRKKKVTNYTTGTTQTVMKRPASRLRLLGSHRRRLKSRLRLLGSHRLQRIRRDRGPPREVPLQP